MLSYIEGTVGELRELTFENSGGYMGENRACGLKIRLDSSDMQGADRYYVSFEPYPGKTIISNEISGNNCEPAYIDSDYIYCPLTSELTASGSLGVQVSAVFTGGSADITVKSSVSRIFFGFSLSPEAGPMDGGYESIFEKLGRIEEKLGRIEDTLCSADYGYITAAVCACLLGGSGGAPVFFPSSRDEAARVTEEILEGITGDEDILAYVAAPAGEGGSACLIRVASHGGSGVITEFEGKDLLEFMKQEADI